MACVYERISRCASLSKEQGSGDNSLMKAIPESYQNLAFTLLPRAKQSSWLFIVVAAVVVIRAAAAAVCHCLEHHAAR
jgi:hypothetical protein